jgi:hypothetical protein
MAARSPSAEDGCVRTVDRGYRDYVAVPLRPDRGSFWLRRLSFSGGFNRSAQHRLETYQLEF